MSGAAPHTLGRYKGGIADRGSTSDLHGPLFTPTRPSFQLVPVALLARRTTAVWRHSRKAQTVI